MNATNVFHPAARDLIHAGLQDLTEARTRFARLADEGVDAGRLHAMLDALADACDPDMALRNLADIITTLQTQGRALDEIIPDTDALARLIAVLGASDAMGKAMRFRIDLVEAASVDRCNSHLFNPKIGRASCRERV